MEVGIHRDEDFQYRTTDRQGNRKIDDCKGQRIPYYDEEVDRRRWDSPRRGQSEIIKRTVLARDTVSSTPIICTGTGELRANPGKLYKNSISHCVEDTSAKPCECSVGSRRDSMLSCELSSDVGEYLNDDFVDYVEVVDACTNTNLGGKRYRGPPKPFNPYISEYMANFNRCPRFEELGQQCNCYIEPTPSMTENVTLTVQRPLVTPYKTMLNSPPMVPPMVAPMAAPMVPPMQPVFFLDNDAYTGPPDQQHGNYVQCKCGCTCTQEHHQQHQHQHQQPPEHQYHQEQNDTQELEKQGNELSGRHDSTSSSSVSIVKESDTSNDHYSTTTMKISLNSFRKRSYSQTKLDYPLKSEEAVNEEQKAQPFQNRHVENVNHESTSTALESMSLSMSNTTDNQLSDKGDRRFSSELLMATTNLTTTESSVLTPVLTPPANTFVVNYVSVKPYQSVPMMDADNMQKINKQIVMNANKMSLRFKKRKRVYKPMLMRKPSKDHQRPRGVISQRIQNAKVKHNANEPNRSSDRDRDRNQNRNREKPLQNRATTCPRCLGNVVSSGKGEKSKTRSLFSFLKFPWRKT